MMDQDDKVEVGYEMIGEHLMETLMSAQLLESRQ